MITRMAYLHIGFHKSGSTTIQRTLAQSRVQLSDSGYFYSVEHLQSRTQHSHLALALRGGNLGQYETAIAAISRDFRNTGHKRLIISGEEFSTLKPDLIEHFIRSMSEVVTDFKVIVYIRNFYKFMLSIIAQYSKAGDTIIYPQTAIDRLKTFNPTAVVHQWENAVGRGNVQVACLDTLPPGIDIIDTFGVFLGVELPKVMSSLNENQSIDSIASTILTHLAFEFGLSEPTFYSAYFSELHDRIVLPRIEAHAFDLMDDWVKAVDLSHPKLLPFSLELISKPIGPATGVTSDQCTTRLEEYLLFMSAVMKKASNRLSARRLGSP